MLLKIMMISVTMALLASVNSKLLVISLKQLNIGAIRTASTKEGGNGFYNYSEDPLKNVRFLHISQYSSCVSLW